MIAVEGELSNITYHVSGHLYFTVKDSRANLKAVVFSYKSKGVDSSLKHGDSVRLYGRLTIYEASGQYQILCNFIEKKKDHGDLYKKYLALKEKLSEKGYFDSKFKKEIVPSLNVGVVTSEKGAVIRDIVSTAISRSKGVNIFLYPAQVQGDSVEDIIKGIEFFNSFDSVDIIIIGRGGGSFEDLNLFNSESLAEAIFESKKPIISAVGHETDYVISDFVADARAATPTQAAVIAVLNEKEIINNLNSRFNLLNRNLLFCVESNFTKLASKESVMHSSMQNLLKDVSRSLDNRVSSYTFKNFPDRVESNFIAVDDRLKDLNSKISAKLENLKSSFLPKVNLVNCLNPLDILSRGYSLTFLKGSNISSMKQIEINDEIETRLTDGVVRSKVIAKK